MNIVKFSLPEGCDLKLKVNGVAANIVVTYKGEEISSVCRTLMGLGLSLRRSVLGVNYVYGMANDGWGRPLGHPTMDLRDRIRDAVSNFRSASDVLADNLRHFENLQMSEETIVRMRDLAQVAYRATRDRMVLAATSMSFRVVPPVDTFSMPHADIREYYGRTQLEPIRPEIVGYIPTRVDLDEE